MKRDMKKRRMAVPGGHSEVSRHSGGRYENGNLETLKRTDDKPTPTSNAGREDHISELGTSQVSTRVVEDLVRREEAGVPSRMQHDKVIAKQEAADTQGALASDVFRRGGADGKYLKAIQLLAPHVRRVLYRPATGLPLVAGTTVAEVNVVKLVQALRERSALGTGRGAKLAGGLLQQLTLERAPGPTTVERVKVAQLMRLIDLLRQTDMPSTGRRAHAGGARISETQDVEPMESEMSSGLKDEPRP